MAAVATVVLIAAMLLAQDVEAGSPSYDSSLATTGLVARQDDQDQDDGWDMISTMVMEGVSLGLDSLNSVRWATEVANDLHSAVINQIGAFITWFNFLAGFVTPDGVGAKFLAWLRGAPAPMSRRQPTPSQWVVRRHITAPQWPGKRFSRFKPYSMEF